MYLEYIFSNSFPPVGSKISVGTDSNSSPPQELNPAHTAANNEAANNLNIFIIKLNLRSPVPYG